MNVCWSFAQTLSKDKESVLNSVFMLLANLLLLFNFWLYACYMQSLADIIWSIKHAGADGCFKKIWPLQVLTAVLIILIEVSLTVAKQYTTDAVQLLLQAFIVALKGVFLGMLVITFMRVKVELARQPEYQLSYKAVSLLLVSYSFYIVPIWFSYWVMQICNEVSVILFTIVLMNNARCFTIVNQPEKQSVLQS